MFAALGLAGIAGKILDFLKSPIGILVIIIGAYFVGHYRGGKEAQVDCANQRAASRDAARKIDQKATGESQVAHEQQLRASEARAVAAEKAVAEYAQRFKDSPECALGPAADELNRLRDGNPVPGRQP